MKKVILTVLVGIVCGQVFLKIVSFAPDAVWDIESVIAMYFVGPLIALATIYGSLVYEKIMDR